MAKNNRICKVCGIKYYYCPSCDDERRPRWHIMFHDEQCRNIFDLLTDHFLGKITDDYAKEQLLKYDLSDMSSYNESIRSQIEHILDSTKENAMSADKLSKPKRRSSSRTKFESESKEL